MEHKEKDIDKYECSSISDDAFYVLADEDEHSELIENEKESTHSSDMKEKTEDSNEFGPLKMLFLTLGSPVEGWKQLRRSRLSAERLAQGCFYPLLALMALATFATLVYIPATPLYDLVVNALIMFISYFLGYFCVILLLKTLLPADCRTPFEKDFGKGFVMLSMSTLSIVQILVDIMPFLQPLLVFLPLYTIYLIVKGVKYLRCPANRNVVLMVTVSLLVIGVPPLLQWIFGMMMPVNALPDF